MLLSGCVMLGIAFGVGISLVINHLFGLPPLSNELTADISSKHTDHWYIRMSLVAVEHAFTFLIPGVFFWYLYDNKTWDDFSAKSLSKVSFTWMVVAVMITLVPMNQLIIQWNQNIHLPVFLEGVESSMRAKELEKAFLTEKLLRIHLISELLVAITVFGIVGPIGEEVFFRGVLQTKLAEWGLSPGKSICVAAAIFSLIHFQFYGFFPRLLLGVLFGYLFLWSGNIWVPIVAHVINNSLFVLTAFGQQNWPFLKSYFSIFSGNWIWPILSFIVVAFILFFFRLKNLNPKPETQPRIQ